MPKAYEPEEQIRYRDKNCSILVRQGSKTTIEWGCNGCKRLKKYCFNLQNVWLTTARWNGRQFWHDSRFFLISTSFATSFFRSMLASWIIKSRICFIIKIWLCTRISTSNRDALKQGSQTYVCAGAALSLFNKQANKGDNLDKKIIPFFHKFDL